MLQSSQVFFSILADLGLGPAIIQYQELDSKDYGSIFIFSCGLGLCLSCVFIFFGDTIKLFSSMILLMLHCVLGCLYPYSSTQSTWSPTGYFLKARNLN
ncbi:oligosaccharide flippase family protein [Bifidobacterium moukalabense]|uniref:oligosaccharide flippase family protein n=1 Tax=Bifidobacterium moukalabense TaxID=1333651 RepID=UPI0022848F6C|nr:oligosaccharide flippase family protein [Bifidobacterium moukalabense]